MFTKNGNSKNVNLIGELVAGLTLGLGVGLIWKVCSLLVRVLPPVFIHNPVQTSLGSTVLAHRGSATVPTKSEMMGTLMKSVM
jgi:hypothetical protein